MSRSHRPSRVLVDATPLQSEHRSRGVGTYVREFIDHTEALDERAPWYVASTFGRPEDLHRLPTDRTVRVFRPHRPAQVYWAFNEVALRLAILRLRPRIFFAPDFNGLVRNPFGITVGVLHDLAPLKMPMATKSTGLGHRLDDLRWWAYYRKLAVTDHLVARSESTKKDGVELLGLSPAKITVIAQGLSHDAFPNSYGSGPYASTGAYFVHVGGRNENKNQIRILDAFARLPRECRDVQLLFAGPWSAGDLSWLQAHKQRLGLDDRVRHVGYVDEGDLGSLYGNSLAVVFPSLEEGYGLPVLEGMASGGPVITSNRSSMPEIAGDAALLVDPEDPVALSEAMRQLALDPDLRQKHRDAGLRRASQFSWRQLANDTWSVLDQLTAPMAGSGPSSGPSTL